MECGETELPVNPFKQKQTTLELKERAAKHDLKKRSCDMQRQKDDVINTNRVETKDAGQEICPYKDK